MSDNETEDGFTIYPMGWPHLLLPPSDVVIIDRYLRGHQTSSPVLAEFILRLMQSPDLQRQRIQLRIHRWDNAVCRYRVLRQYQFEPGMVAQAAAAAAAVA